MSNIFKQIIDGKLPSTKLFENDRLIVIEDKYPLAPVHVLLIPKKEYPSIQAVPKEDLPLIQEIFEVAQKIAKEKGVEDQYRLLTNNGTKAGQTIFHLHFHLIGGKELGPMA